MNIPSTCEKWERQMGLGSADQQQIIENYRLDACVPSHIESAFFDEIASEAVPTSPDEAVSAIRKVMERRKADFTCTGKPVPSERFDAMVRLEGGTSLAYRMRKNTLSKVRKRLGLPKSNPFKNQKGSLLRELAAEVREEPVRLGNQYEIVWATELEGGVHELPDLQNLFERLGLNPFPDEEVCLIMVYSRTIMSAELYVPRVLDAVHESAFRPTADCSAPTGMTEPFNSLHNRGLPEAVHKKCEVKLSLFEVRNMP